jgi:hypothetical protein
MRHTVFRCRNVFHPRFEVYISLAIDIKPLKIFLLKFIIIYLTNINLFCVTGCFVIIEQNFCVVISDSAHTPPPTKFSDVYIYIFF